MLVWETDWETCLHQCWGQQDFGRSSAFVGGGEERGTRESEGWRRRKREDFAAVQVLGHVAMAGWCQAWLASVFDGGWPWELTAFNRLWLLTTTSRARSHALSPRPQSAGGSQTWASRCVKGAVRLNYLTKIFFTYSFINDYYSFIFICLTFWEADFCLPLVLSSIFTYIWPPKCWMMALSHTVWQQQTKS